MSGEEVDAQYLMDKCPTLESAFNEVLRMISAGALLREVTSPTVIGGKVLQAGHRVIVSIPRTGYFNHLAVV